MVMNTNDTDRDRSETLRRVTEIVKEVVGGEVPVTEATRFMEDIETDSLTIVRIDALIQAKLGLALPASDLSQLRTVGDLAEALRLRGLPVEED
jgi:acyl carrier protein